MHIGADVRGHLGLAEGVHECVGVVGLIGAQGATAGAGREPPEERQRGLTLGVKAGRAHISRHHEPVPIVHSTHSRHSPGWPPCYCSCG